MFGGTTSYSERAKYILKDAFSYYNCCVSACTNNFRNAGKLPGWHIRHIVYFLSLPFSYPEPFLRAVNGARQGALAKSISNWHLIGYNEGYCSNNVYILLPCFYGIRFWPEPLVAPRVRRALGTRMCPSKQATRPSPLLNWEMASLVPRPLQKRAQRTRD